MEEEEEGGNNKGGTGTCAVVSDGDEVGAGASSAIRTADTCQYHISESTPGNLIVNLITVTLSTFAMSPSSSLGIFAGSSSHGRPLFLCGPRWVDENGPRKSGVKEGIWRDPYPPLYEQQLENLIEFHPIYSDDDYNEEAFLETALTPSKDDDLYWWRGLDYYTELGEDKYLERCEDLGAGEWNRVVSTCGGAYVVLNDVSAGDDEGGGAEDNGTNFSKPKSVFNLKYKWSDERFKVSDELHSVVAYPLLTHSHTPRRSHAPPTKSASTLLTTST